MSGFATFAGPIVWGIVVGVAGAFITVAGWLNPELSFEDGVTLSPWVWVGLAIAVAGLGVFLVGLQRLLEGLHRHFVESRAARQGTSGEPAQVVRSAGN